MKNGKAHNGEDPGLVRQARLAAVVIAVAFILWMGAQWLGGAMRWPPRYAFLFDFAALGALVWSLIVLIRVWRARQRNEDG